MSDKKHIDRLFQEKLKNFEVAPDDSVWEQINSRLHKEDRRERRVIPIWWKLAGVAAILALLLTLGMKVFSDYSNSSKTIVDTEKQIQNDGNNSFESNSSEKSNDPNHQIDDNNAVAEENAVNSDDSAFGNFPSDVQETPNASSNGNGAHNQQNSSAISNRNQNAVVSTDKSNSQDKSLKNRGRQNKFISEKDKLNNSKNAVANTILKNDDKTIQNQSNNPEAKNTSEIDKLIKDSQNNNDSKVSDASETMEETEFENKEELTEEITKDNSIEDAIADAETENEEEKKLNRWNISPNVAPVYFNSLGKGSAIDEQFVNNEKEGQVTMSYGVGGSYAINDRLKVRAGINKVNMGYNTNNVIAFNSISAFASDTLSTNLGNVDVNTTGEEGIVYMSTQNLDNSRTPEIINVKSNGSLNQRFGFIEIPMEVEYAILNKKLGVNVIGGFSTLIVDENDIYAKVDGVETRIGEANNINDMSYSANFGLGINYNISEKIKLNVEPTFKYQINTFNNSSGNFQPFFIGVYTGLSYKF